MKEYECTRVTDHKDVGTTIKEWQKNGWSLHTYQVGGARSTWSEWKPNHYLLFEKGE